MNSPLPDIKVRAAILGGCAEALATLQDVASNPDATRDQILMAYGGAQIMVILLELTHPELGKPVITQSIIDKIGNHYKFPPFNE